MKHALKSIPDLNLTMPNNISSMRYALKLVPGLADVGVPMGLGMAPELHPHVCIKGQKFWPKANSLVLAGGSGMDEKPSLDSFLLPSLGG